MIPVAMLETLASAYESAVDWVREEQREPYGRGKDKEFDGPSMPGAGEEYVASFDKSLSLLGLPLVAEAARLIGGNVWRCYRMGPGQGFRTHTDGYFGGDSHVLYLTRKWRWDWGGLLHTVSDDGDHSETVLPQMGLVATLSGGDVAHFVSTVEPWAEAPRYVLAVFGRAVEIKV